MNTVNYFHWNVGPELVSFGSFSIAWYGLLFASGFFIGFHIMRWVFSREGKSLATIDTLFIYMALGAVAGARLGHILFYDPAYYLANPLEILKIWQGGLASHGGVVGMLIAMYVYAKKTAEISFLWLLDRMTLVIALGSFFIRSGNFFNSEILGIPTTVPWAIVFSRFDSLPRHPAQLYEAAVYLLLFVLLSYLYMKHREKLKPGFMMGLLMVIIFGSRFLIEFVKVPQESFAPILNLNMGQWLSIPVVLLGLCLMFIKAKSYNPNVKNVIFDLGAVMFDWNPKKIAENFTNDIELQNRIQSELYYHQDWMDFDCALITEKEAIERASERLGIYLVDTEKLFQQTKQSLILISRTFEVLKDVKNKKLNAYCLSNISPELFKYLNEQHELFKLFDGIVTSGAENVGKPGKRIFEILFERYDLNPTECLFIDDSEENTATANEFGVTTVTFKASQNCYKTISRYI
ncbi:MAG: hypothetical protein BMS9Abin31_0028 [Gammaproteobacteria bacterium]|nr:MAG: hypothetical protein BMS9Abin31_0028 [Gammaproteobacteria bacterium]